MSYQEKEEQELPCIQEMVQLLISGVGVRVMVGVGDGPKVGEGLGVSPVLE